MDMLFFDIFPQLKNNTGFSALLSDAVITDIRQNKKTDTCYIYFVGKNLIPKRRIHAIESEIHKQCFENAPEVSVYLVEKYSLSDQYTPENLFENYSDSMLDELREHDKILCLMLRDAKVSFDGNVMILSIPDSLNFRERENELSNYLFNVFSGRFGMPVSFRYVHTPVANREFLKRRQMRIEEETRRIMERVDREKNRIEMIDGSTVDADGNVMDDGKTSASGKAPRKQTSFGKTSTGQEGGHFHGKKSTPRPSGRPFSLKRSDHPGVIYGDDFEEDPVPISEIVEENQMYAFKGEILSVDDRTTKTNKRIVQFAVTDETDSISVKLFVPNELADPFIAELAPGSYVKVYGMTTFDPQYDREMMISRVRGIVKSSDFHTYRMDTAPEKRVELHCHTKMSDFDGVSDVKDIVRQAIRWGHRAIAITDHGVVHAFPDAAECAKDHPDFKIIYGVECYLVDDTKKIVADSKNQSLNGDFVVFDLETTGLDSSSCRIIEIGAVYISGGKIVKSFSKFVNPNMPLPPRIVELTNIHDEDVASADDIAVVLPEFRSFCGDAVLVAHNADFDTSCLKAACRRLHLDWSFTYMDTIAMARFLMPHLSKFKLDTVASHLGVPLLNHHRAIDDATCTAGIFLKLSEKLADMKLTTLDQINAEGRMKKEQILKAPMYHCILLAKNDIGRINLYRLISKSHLDYFSRRPRMPKSLIDQHREGLIIGSACEAGELFRAVLNGRDPEEIARIASFYDYFEVQPIGNNAFMLRSEDIADKYNIRSKEDLRSINRKIVSLGERLHKPVVATCDVHFLNPEDEIYRRIIMSAKGFSDADFQPPLYLHTTDEMLSEFSYLGSTKAHEIVIDNPNRIVDMCDFIQPTRPDKCPPVIENSDGMLREICYTKAHEIYGTELPKIVSARLERELNSIISNGYAVMYIIAQKLVWKSNEDGYLVGSRGSVGSSFVATMAGITEVNPLSPHYVCPHCHYTDFDSEEVRAYAGRSGFDMPDKKCPVCGHYLKKDGFDIPFETFLGFKGNKEPDIDLNFSNDYQNKAHRYTEVIFGEGQTFKAGTIGTIKDNTAYGFVMHYFRDHGQKKREPEIERIERGCMGVKSSTGQHPGGIVVLPMGEEINTFTPVQKPANKVDSDLITTHFDYHKIDGNLLKLDILGHLDPTMIKYLEELTGVRATDIPFDDSAVMSLFESTEALSVEPDDLWKTSLGTLGIPEFGTDFAMGMLRDAKPKAFTDLVRIAGLAHGTDVWVGNAQDLILSGKATISTAICTRDDIMTYLISKGLDSEESFTIMERVRKGVVKKGKAAEWPKWKQDMLDHGVPEWYVESCEKIAYMFPKAHAAAYVMMSWRVAYYKVYYPLAYYAAYFSIRAKAFSYEKMCLGKATCEANLREVERRMQESGKKGKDDDLYGDLRLVQEMYARGFSFLKIDLYESDARYFTIKDGKLLPPFTAIEGLGEIASEQLYIAAHESPFLSKQDMRERGKISGTSLEKFEELGLLPDLPDNNQISIFDFGTQDVS